MASLAATARRQSEQYDHYKDSLKNAGISPRNLSVVVNPDNLEDRSRVMFTLLRDGIEQLDHTQHKKWHATAKQGLALARHHDGGAMKHEITTLLDNLNSASERLLFIQGMVATEQDVRALKVLMGYAIEYITELNLILLKDEDELKAEQFKSSLLIEAVKQFVLDVHDLKISLKTPQALAG